MPAVDGRYLCFGTADGTLVTLNAETGEQEWQQQINDDQSVLSSPTIANDIVLVGSDDSYLVAFDVETGVELWRFETEAAVDANPSVVDGGVYVADNAGNVYALG
jgi:outer membrane protein assembly factor BamB